MNDNALIKLIAKNRWLFVDDLSVFGENI